MESNQDEVWVEVHLDGREKSTVKYAISNRGRLMSFVDQISNGKVIKGSRCNDYASLNVKINGKRKHYYIHRLVAEYFMADESEGCANVIHLDYDKRNNKLENLKWVTKDQWWAHFQKNPAVIEARENIKHRKPQVGQKLTSTDVIRIKRMLRDPNRKTRMKIIAKQFNISEMQLYRIRSGENWSHVSPDDEI